MLAFLLACLRNNLAGGGGAGAFTITGVNVSQQQAGTSCGNPMRVTVNLVYTGLPGGATCQVERSFRGGGYEVVSVGVPPASFPIVVDVPGYYNKFGVAGTVSVRVTDETNALNTATGSFGSTFNLCGGA